MCLGGKDISISILFLTAAAAAVVIRRLENYNRKMSCIIQKLKKNRKKQNERKGMNWGRGRNEKVTKNDTFYL